MFLNWLILSKTITGYGPNGFAF